MRSPMNSAACKQYIVDWYAQNDTALPLFPPALKLPVNANGGRGGLKSGFDPSGWRRAAKSTIENKIYRLFTPNSNVIDPSVYILLVESDRNIESLTVGTKSDFVHYFSKITV